MDHLPVGYDVGLNIHVVTRMHASLGDGLG